MSYQAMEAVQDHSQYTEDSPENFAPFKILMAIARNADRLGVTGVSGNHRQCLSHRGIAKIANVHRNTVGTWIPKLIESGEITIESGGSGRASWTVYFLQLPIDDTARAAEPELSAQGTAQTSAQGMAQQMELLAQGMAQLTELLAQALAQGGPLMAQGNGTNGTSPQSNACQIQDTLIQNDPQIQQETAGDPVDLGPSEEENDELSDEQPIPAPFDWPCVLDDLKNSMTKDTFNANLRGTTAVIRDGTLEIVTKNQYQADWINGRLKGPISRTVANITGRKLGIWARPPSLREKELM